MFQVRIDGVPMQGHLSAIGPFTTAGIFVSIDNESEQLSDPARVVAYNVFARVRPGAHTVQAMVAAGSGIDPNNLPTVGSPVLTLEHRSEADKTTRQFTGSTLVGGLAVALALASGLVVALTR